MSWNLLMSGLAGHLPFLRDWATSEIPEGAAALGAVSQVKVWLHFVGDQDRLRDLV
jgi:hypothetical protein